MSRLPTNLIRTVTQYPAVLLALFAGAGNAAVFNPAPVTTDGAAGSLRQAIITANSNGESDTINLSAGTYSLTLTNSAGQENAAAEGDLDITEAGQAISIQGAGSGVTFIDQTVMDRVFHVIGNTTLRINGVTITNGTAVDNGTLGNLPGSGDGDGGGILNEGGTVALTSTIITNNTALGDDIGEGGGGIFQRSGDTTVNSGSKIDGNQATGLSGSGGGIFMADGSLTTGGGSTIDLNTANRSGGGIEVAGGTLSALTTLIRNNNVNGNAGAPNPGRGGGVSVSGGSLTATLDNSIVGTNIAAENGGGLWLETGSTFNVISTQVFDNVAHGDGGGGIFNNGGQLALSSGAGPGRVQTNMAPGTNGSGHGGGIMSSNGSITITGTASQRPIVSDNTAAGWGGGIYTTGSLTTNIAGINGNISSGFGGGISAIGDSVDLTDTQVTGNNVSVAGAGIYNQGGNTTVQGGSLIDDNTAGGAGGGYSQQGASATLIVDGSTVSNNNAGFLGGGLEANNGSITVQNNALITGNHSNSGGGGIIVQDNVTLTIDNSTISANTSDNNAGGIMVRDSTLAVTATITGSTISGNSSVFEGGGIFVGSMGSLQVGSNSTISLNTAGTNGGGIFVRSSATGVDLSNTQIIDNIANGNSANQGGGGIFNDGFPLILPSTVIISGNQANGASGSGGGIFNDTGGTLTITGSTITGNSASRAGGGIEDNSGAGLGVSLNGVDLNSNSTGSNPGNGGGLHVTGAGDVTITGGRVNGNTASSEGGGLWNGSGVMNVSGVLIDDNTAGGDASDNGGGGIFNAGGVVNVSGATLLAGNQATGAAGSGGGIFNDVGGFVSIVNATIANNGANRAGGGIEDNSGAGPGISLNSVTLDGNSAGANPGNGGGLHVTGSGDVSITASLVLQNTAGREGGGLWNGSGAMTISDTLVLDNTASGPSADDGGGGIFNNGGTLDIGMTTFVDSNVADGAAGNGGGIHSNGGTLTMNGTEVVNNNPQGVFVAAGTSASLVNVIATGNSFEGLDALGASNVSITGGNYEGMRSRATTSVDTFLTVQASGLIDLETTNNIDVNTGGIGGSANMILSPGAFAVFDAGTSTQHTGTTQMTSGQTQVNGTFTDVGGNVTVEGSAALGGTGVIDRTVIVNGTLDPGLFGSGSRGEGHGPDSESTSQLRAPGLFMITDLRMNTGSTLQLELDGLVAGTIYDQVQVESVDLDNDNGGGANLNLSVGFTPSLGDQFTIIDVTTANPVAGTFNDLAEGDLVAGDGSYFTISYVGGDGNDVVLTNASPTIYVDANSMNRGGPPGTSWATAFSNLQDGLAAAVPGSEIWVAQGVYFPDEGSGQVDNDPDATFTLMDQVSVFGGFNGTEALRNERDPENNLTILSGDIDGDDVNVDNNFIAESVADIQGQNAFHVLTLDAPTTNLTLDGFTVTAGDAVGGANNRGGGLVCPNGNHSINLLQMHFIGNRANRGGAYSVCSSFVRDSSFVNNFVNSVGGVYDGEGGNFDRVLFQGNVAGGQGGVMYLGGTPATIRRSAFIGNRSNTGVGGAIRIVGSITMSDVLFRGNAAGNNDPGGALYVGGSGNVLLTNLTFSGNSSDEDGGAIRIDSSGMHAIENTIVWNNEDSSGVGNVSSSVHFTDGTLLISNSLIQGSGGSSNWDPTAGTDGGGNLDEDPLFVNDTDPTTAPTEAGDAHLIDGTNAENAGDNSFVTSATDLDGRNRIRNGTVDMGAYEGPVRLFEDSFEELDMN